MKLVDILARELKVWPEGVKYYSQTAHRMHVANFYDGKAMCLSQAIDLAEDQNFSLVSYGEWRAAVITKKLNGDFAPTLGDMIMEGWVRPKAMHMQCVGRVTRQLDLDPAAKEPEAKPAPSAGWAEGELPPVGTVCLTDHKRKEITVKILAYGDHHIDKCVLAADMSHGFEGKMFGWIASQCVFRPLETPQQKAAKEREEAIKQICIDAGSPELTPVQIKVAEKLYLAGYRKQVTK